MAGAYTAYVMQQVLGSAGISLLVSIPIGFVVGGLLGVILEATLIRRMYHRPLDTLLVTWGVSLSCVIALSAVIAFTTFGRRVRAVVQNRDLAETVGVSTRATDRLTFFIGSGLAGVAGVALTLLGSTGPTLGTNYIVDAFLVVVVGGIGQIRGAVIAALVLGLLQSIFQYTTTASMAKVLLFVAIVVFLQLRPQGIVSVRTRSLA